MKGVTETQPLNLSNITELAIIDSTQIINDKLVITLKNHLINNHTTNLLNENQKNLILYPTLTSNGEIEILDQDKNYKIPIDPTEDRFSDLTLGDYIMIDWGVKRMVNLSGDMPYEIDQFVGKEYYTTKIYKVMEVGVDYIKINNPIVKYPSGTKMMLLKNNLSNKSGLKYNFLSTQPFVVNNKFYTKIFYKGVKSNVGIHYDNEYKIKKIIGYFFKGVFVT